MCAAEEIQANLNQRIVKPVPNLTRCFPLINDATDIVTGKAAEPVGEEAASFVAAPAPLVLEIAGPDAARKPPAHLRAASTLETKNQQQAQADEEADADKMRMFLGQLGGQLVSGGGKSESQEQALHLGPEVYFELGTSRDLRLTAGSFTGPPFMHQD